MLVHLHTINNKSGIHYIMYFTFPGSAIYAKERRITDTASQLFSNIDGVIADNNIERKCR